MNTNSVIHNAFQNQTILLTGATGFVGKVLLEKLLRVCYDLKTIYIIVRAKKESTAEERFRKLFENACFENLRKTRTDFFEKIQVIEGDCNAPRLGLSDQNCEILKKEVTIIIGAAADVRFDQELKNAIYCNIRGVKEMLDLAKEVAQLKALIYVSTAYSNASENYICEKFYEPVIKAEDLFQLADFLDEETLKKITPILLKKWPNVYTFSKCVAEDLIKREGKDLPVAIVRPGIIVCSLNEPVPGWVDNLYGLLGLFVGVLSGAIRSIYSDKDIPIHCVPCDYVVNLLLAVTWDLCTEKPNSDIKIYNFVSDRPMIAYQLTDSIEHLKWKYPSERMIWFPSCTYTNNYVWHKFRIFIFQILFPKFIDFVLMCFGKRPFASKIYGKVNKLLDVTSYFCRTRFQFDTENVKKLWNKMGKVDQELFIFDVNQIEWNSFVKVGVKKVREFIVKETPGDWGRKRRKLMVFAFFHYAVTGFVVYFLLKVLYNIVFMFM